MRVKFLLLVFSVSLILSGCGIFGGGVRIKGGTTTHSSATGSKTELKQSDDPKNASSTDNSSKITEEIILPSQTQIDWGDSVKSKNLKDTNFIGKLTLPAGTIIKRTIEDQNKINIGSAQKNIIGETIAKLNSLKWIQFIGIVLILAGIASATYPPLKLIVGSLTTSVWIGVAGLVLIFAPVLVVGNEGLILAIAFGLPILWFIAHRYSKASTEARIYKDFIDSNKDGIDDREQNLPKKDAIN